MTKPGLAQFSSQARDLIARADLALKTAQPGAYEEPCVAPEALAEFRAGGLSFLLRAFGATHPYYLEFESRVKSLSDVSIHVGRGILAAVASELEHGWIGSARSLAAADIFCDFLEMADYLLEQSYKDPAAVIGGAVLEEHLRSLAVRSDVSITFTNSVGKQEQKKAATLNADLVKEGAYSKLDRSNIEAWQKIRNYAAHGEFTQYNDNQVATMLMGIRDFIVRNPSA
jgi:hypothetical protein